MDGDVSSLNDYLEGCHFGGTFLVYLLRCKNRWRQKFKKKTQINEQKQKQLNKETKTKQTNKPFYIKLVQLEFPQGSKIPP